MDNMTRFHIVIITKSAMISQFDAFIVIASFAWHFHINRPFIAETISTKLPIKPKSFDRCLAVPFVASEFVATF